MNISITHKKYLSVALIMGLLFILPVAVFISQKQQEIRSRATNPTPTDISDDFSGASLDSSVWSSWVYPATVSGTIKQENGVIRTTIDSGQNFYHAAVAELLSKNTGDFEAVVDLKIEQGGMPYGADTGLVFHDDSWQNTIWLSLRRTTDGPYHLIAGSTTNGSTTDHFSKAFNNSGPLTVKLERINNVVNYYYKDNSGQFFLLGSETGLFFGDGRFALHVNSWEPNYPAVTSTFDNFNALVNLVVVPSPTPTPVVPCITLPTNDQFNDSTTSANFWNNWFLGNGNATVNGGVLQSSAGGISADSIGRLITKNKVCGDFDTSIDVSQFTSSSQDNASAVITAEQADTNSAVYIQLHNSGVSQGFETDERLNGNWQNLWTEAKSPVTAGKLRIRRIGSVFTVYYDTNDGAGWKLLKTYPNGFSGDVNIGIGVGSWTDHPSVSANFDNFGLTQAIADPSITPLPPTPTLSPVPTPPSGADKYTIDVGNKQSLSINIGAAINPLIRFKVKLASLRTYPDLYLRMRVRDEAATVKNPVQSVSDACNNPPQSDKDFYIPVHAAGDTYSSVAQNSSTVPTAPGATAAAVSADGWVTLDEIVPGRYYTIYLKGPKTRKGRMIQHVLLQPSQISSQDFDWTGSPLDPGDLPDPNNSGNQDCVINATDWSLLQSRIGSTDGPALSVCDVNYDGICNAGDSVALLNTLGKRPDDDQ